MWVYAWMCNSKWPFQFQYEILCGSMGEKNWSLVPVFNWTYIISTRPKAPVESCPRGSSYVDRLLEEGTTRRISSTSCKSAQSFRWDENLCVQHTVTITSYIIVVFRLSPIVREEACKEEKCRLLQLKIAWNIKVPKVPKVPKNIFICSRDLHAI